MSKPLLPLRLPKMRADQWAIVAHPAREKVIVMGRRWGKSTMAGAVSLASAAHGATVAWVVPTYKNGRPLWRWVERAIAPLGKHIKANKSERVVSFPGGGFVGIYSADNPSSILGEAFDLVIVDEAASVAEDVWAETLMPTLADRDGRAMLIGTPKGRNWFWREYINADGVTIAAFNAPSTANPNPNIQHAAAMARERVPERVYRQEWMAEFVDNEGVVFRNVYDCATGALQDNPIPGHIYVAGMDIGRVNDYSVVVVIDATTSQVAYIDRYTGVGFAMQEERVKAVYERFKPEILVVEQNNFGFPFIESLVQQNLPVRPFRTTNQTKAHVIESLALAFEHQSIVIPHHTELLNELLSYQIETLPSGLMRYNAPDGQHDDIVMALAFAWYANERQ